MKTLIGLGLPLAVLAGNATLWTGPLEIPSTEPTSSVTTSESSSDWLHRPTTESFDSTVTPVVVADIRAWPPVGYQNTKTVSVTVTCTDTVTETVGVVTETLSDWLQRPETKTFSNAPATTLETIALPRALTTHDSREYDRRGGPAPNLPTPSPKPAPAEPSPPDVFEPFEKIKKFFEALKKYFQNHPKEPDEPAHKEDPEEDE